MKLWTELYEEEFLGRTSKRKGNLRGVYKVHHYSLMRVTVMTWLWIVILDHSDLDQYAIDKYVQVEYM